MNEADEILYDDRSDSSDEVVELFEGFVDREELKRQSGQSSSSERVIIFDEDEYDSRKPWRKAPPPLDADAKDEDVEVTDMVSSSDSVSSSEHSTVESVQEDDVDEIEWSLGALTRWDDFKVAVIRNGSARRYSDVIGEKFFDFDANLGELYYIVEGDETEEGDDTEEGSYDDDGGGGYGDVDDGASAGTSSSDDSWSVFNIPPRKEMEIRERNTAAIEIIQNPASMIRGSKEIMTKLKTRVNEICHYPENALANDGKKNDEENDGHDDVKSSSSSSDEDDDYVDEPKEDIPLLKPQKQSSRLLNTRKHGKLFSQRRCFLASVAIIVLSAAIGVTIYFIVFKRIHTLPEGNESDESTTAPSLSMAPSTTKVPTLAPSLTLLPSVSFKPVPGFEVESKDASSTGTPSLLPSPTKVTSDSIAPSAATMPSLAPSISISPTLSPSKKVNSDNPTRAPSLSNFPTEAPSKSIVPSATIMPSSLSDVSTKAPSESIAPSATIVPSLAPSISISPTISSKPSTLPPAEGNSNNPTGAPSSSISPTLTILPSLTPSISVSPSASPIFNSGTNDAVMVAFDTSTEETSPHDIVSTKTSPPNEILSIKGDERNDPLVTSSSSSDAPVSSTTLRMHNIVESSSSPQMGSSALIIQDIEKRVEGSATKRIRLRHYSPPQ